MNSMNNDSVIRLLVKDISITLQKGKNLVFYNELFPQNSLGNSANKLVFTLTLFSKEKPPILRTFSQFPLQLKTKNNSKTHMNDSIISLTNLDTTTITLLVAQNTEDIRFETIKFQPKTQEEKKSKDNLHKWSYFTVFAQKNL